MTPGVPGPEVVVYLESVTKIYRMGPTTVPALSGVSLKVPRGEYLAIMGASGSGKSTLLNVLGCLDTPTSGRYLLEGARVDNLSDDQLARFRNAYIGFVFQSYNLLPKLTALENVELPLLYRKMAHRKRRERAREVLARVGLADRMTHRPQELSGGQQQRVSLARALVGEPSLLLADEPTGNLDSRTEEDVMDLVDSLHRDGRTIILVTHERSVAQRAERIITLKDGGIIRVETRRDGQWVSMRQE